MAVYVDLGEYKELSGSQKLVKVLDRYNRHSSQLSDTSLQVLEKLEFHLTPTRRLRS